MPARPNRHPPGVTVRPSRAQLLAAYLLIFVASVAVGACLGWAIWVLFGG